MDSEACYRLKLFVAGHSPRSAAAVANIRRICAEALAGSHELVIVDILAQPEIAEAARILATPTLIKEGPGPVRRIIGDLSDKEKVFSGLGLCPT